MIASWSVFHLIWSINHDLSTSSVNLFPLILKYGVVSKEQENILLELEDRSKHIGDAFVYLSKRYVKYHFARLAHEQAPEKGEAFTAALDGINKIRESLLGSVCKIGKSG